MSQEFLTLGNGELWFARFLPDTQTPGGERYIGHSTAFGLTANPSFLEHIGGNRGVRKRDASALLSIDRAGSFVTDTISPENMAMALLGETHTLEVAGETVDEEVVRVTSLGCAYQLGVSAANPAGVSGLEPYGPGQNLIVALDEEELVEGADYTVDLRQGYLVPVNPAIAGSDLLVSYKTATLPRTAIIAGNTEVEGALRYRAYSATGTNISWFMPWVKLTVDGEIQLKSGDQWVEIPFNISVLEKEGHASLYGNGRAIPPMLVDLDVSNTEFEAGQAPGTILFEIVGKTIQSTLEIDPPDPRIGLFGNDEDGWFGIVGSEAAVIDEPFDIGLLETFGGSVNSPHRTTITLTATASGGALDFSNPANSGWA